MKIGILTHHYICNYGAVLQTFSLQEILKEKFSNDEIKVVNLVNTKHNFINKIGWFRFIRKKDSLCLWIKKIKTPKKFIVFKKNNLDLSAKVKKISDLNNFDLIIVGSDEVWNYLDKKSFNKAKFGVGFNSRVISYAASVGKSSDFTLLKQEEIEGLKRFEHISVRDEDTYNFIYNILKVCPTRVIDPTLLYDFRKTINVIGDKRYILFYYCDNMPSSMFDKVKKYSKENDLLIVGAGEANKKFDISLINITPFEWVQLFRDALYVFTGTFHGTVFSLKYKRPFYVYLTNLSRIKKVDSLLKEFGLLDRKLNSEEELDFAKEINYDKVFEILENKKDESLNFLNKSIGEKNEC